jgi:hypothetical protein
LTFKERFKIISSSEFIPEVFDYHPVWSEYYDYDELDEIEEWGIDREGALKELLEKSREGPHALYTVPIEAFPPERMRFYTLAVITASDGKQFKGSVMNAGELIISVFLDEKQEVILPAHPALREDAIKGLEIIGSSFLMEMDDILDLRFETVIKDGRRKAIEGVFRIEG